MTDHVQLAKDFFKQREFKKACEEYEQAIILQSDNLEAYIGWERALNELNKHEEPTTKYQEATNLNPNHSAGVYYGWGNALYNLKEYQEAITKYQKAVELDFNPVAEAYDWWGNALLHLKQYEDAITKFEKVIEINPDYAEAYYRLGNALRNLARYEEAINTYEEAINTYEEAIKIYEKSKKIDLNYVFSSLSSYANEAYYRWRNALRNLARYEEVINTYEEAIKIYEKSKKIDLNYTFSSLSSYNIAVVYWEQGFYKKAREKFDIVAETYKSLELKAKEDKNADHFFFYGIILQLLNNLDQAEEQYKKGLEIDPNNIAILINLVDFYLDKRKKGLDDGSPSCWVKARQYYLKARNLLKNELNKLEDPETLLDLAKLHLSMDEYQEAESYLLKALKKDTDVADIYTSLGILSVSKENFREATDYFKKALKIAPYDLDIWSKLAEAYLKLKQLSQAESEYRKILGIAPCHVESHIGLGEVYIEMAQESDFDLYSQAIRHFTKAISISNDAEGSKQLSKKELAEVKYSRGYARVQFYESSTVIKDEKLLSEALKDFQNCVKNDPEHYKGRRATEKLQKQTNILLTQNSFKWMRTLFILIPSLSILGFTQWFFWKPFFIQDSILVNHQQLSNSPKATSNVDKTTTNKNKPKETIKSPEKVTQPTSKINTTEYFLLTFGSLTFSLISLYLPQLLKLKIGGTGIEIEKSSIDQIKTSQIPTSLGIKK